MQRRALLFPLLSGLLVGAGLVAGGMTRPDRVIGFFDLFGDWDATLVFVMIGAIGTYLPAHRWVLRRRRAPMVGDMFLLPTRKDIDASLITGAVLFGAGWALAGTCPGPGLVSLATLSAPAVAFVAAMFAGFVLLDRARRWRSDARATPVSGHRSARTFAPARGRTDT